MPGPPGTPKNLLLNDRANFYLIVNLTHRSIGELNSIIYYDYQKYFPKPNKYAIIHEIKFFDTVAQFFGPTSITQFLISEVFCFFFNFSKKYCYILFNIACIQQKNRLAKYCVTEQEQYLNQRFVRV